MKNIDAGAITRLITLSLALLNTILTMTGKNPIPYSETDVGQFVTLLIMGITAVESYWKNNNWTNNAQKAQEYKEQLDNNEPPMSKAEEF